jgi:uncharacterized protein YfiM (DUF2279 family)
VKRSHSLKNPAYLLLIAIGLAPLFTGCAGTISSSDDAWFGQDKGAHFTAAAMIGISSTAVAYRQYEIPETHSIGIGIACALGVGALKEWYDLRVKHAYWSWKDFFWDAVGGVTGSFMGTRIP